MECNYNLELVYRVCDALNLKDTNLSSKLRLAWEKDNALISTNVAAMKILLQSMQENRALSNIK